MKTRLLLLALTGCLSFNQGYSQVGIGTSSPNARAVLELISPTNNQGFLAPRLTTAQRTAVSFTSLLASAEAGLLVFDTDTNKFYYWSGSAWVIIDDSVGTDSQTLSFVSPTLSISGGNSVNLSAVNTDGQTLAYNTGTGLLTISGGNNVTITGTTPGGTAGGDLTGTYPNPTVANNAITSAKILDGTISSSDISDGTIATADIANTAITDAKLGSGITVSKLSPSTTNGQVLTTVAGTTTWANLPASGTVTNIATGTGLTGGPITTTGTISIPPNGVTATELRSDAAIDANRSVTTNHLRDGAVNTSKILDGTIVNVDVSATAAVAVSKLEAGVNAQVLTTVAGVPAWQAPVDNSVTNELQNISSVLGLGNDAGAQNVVNLASVSINTTSTTGALNVIGSHYYGFTVLASTALYNVQPPDYLIIGTTTNSVIGDVRLPPANAHLGRVLILRSRSSSGFGPGGVRFLTTGADTIDGGAQSQLLQQTNGLVYSITVVAISSTEWITISKSVL